MNYYFIFIYLLDTGYVIDYDIRTSLELKENEVLFKTIPEEEYTHISYFPLYDSNNFYLYKVVNNTITITTEEDRIIWLSNMQQQNLQNIISLKINEINNACNNGIVTGIDYNDEHFSNSLEDQNNIDNLFNIVKSSGGTLAVPYHADGKGCRLYSAEDIYNIYKLQKKNTIHHTSYANQLKLYVKSLTTVEEIKNVVYGQELINNYLENYNIMIDQAENVINAMVM